MEKDILTELMQKCGSRVIVNGKEEIMPITDAKTMSSVIFESAEKDAEVRKLFSSVKKIDDEWRQRISDMWWGREEKDPIIDPRLYELREKLLTFGGDAVCMARGEPDIKEILKYGQLWHGYGAVMKKGKASMCHSNAASLSLKRGFYMCTGYALSEDGMWRQHSWCIDVHARTTKIIETTEPRVMYFGFVLDDERRDSLL